MFSETQVMIMAKLFPVVSTFGYSVFIFIIFTLNLSFPVSPYVGKYWNLSEKFSW